MKKSALVTIPALCLALSTTALADIPSITSTTASDIVTLGEYKGLELERTVEPVTDELVDARIDQTLESNMEDIGDGPVADGDVATIDYEGKKDGEAFEGGTSKDYPLEIGSGTFIPGFEEGVVGMKKGETKDINVTFPEEYHSEDLAGQEAVFTVTVKSIERKPELTEEWVQENTDVDTIDAYKAQVREELEGEAEAAANQDLYGQAFQKVFESCTFEEIPSEDIDSLKEAQVEMAKTYAAMYGMEYEDFLSAQGLTEETFDEQITGIAEDQAKQLYVCQAILDAENITITDEEGEELMAEYLVQYDVDSLEALREALNGSDDIDRYIVTQKAMQILVDNASITEAEEETEAEEAPAEEAAAEEAPAEAAAAEEAPAEAEAAAEEAPAEAEAAAEEAPAEAEAAAAEEAPAATEEAPVEETPAE